MQSTPIHSLVTLFLVVVLVLYLAHMQWQVTHRQQTKSTKRKRFERLKPYQRSSLVKVKQQLQHALKQPEEDAVLAATLSLLAYHWGYAWHSAQQRGQLPHPGRNDPRRITVRQQVRFLGCNVDDTLSNAEVLVAVNSRTRTVWMAFRGTDSLFTNLTGDAWYDAFADGVIAVFGVDLNPRLLMMAKQAYTQVRQRYPLYMLKITGHSLGGSVAQSLGHIYQNDHYLARVDTFNAGAGLTDLIGASFDYTVRCNASMWGADGVARFCNIVHDHVIGGDLVSILHQLAPTTETEPAIQNSGNPLTNHQLDQFEGGTLATIMQYMPKS